MFLCVNLAEYNFFFLYFLPVFCPPWAANIADYLQTYSQQDGSPETSGIFSSACHVRQSVWSCEKMICHTV